MSPPLAITVTVKLPAPLEHAQCEALAEEIREQVQQATGALDVELDDWTTSGGEVW